MSRMDEPPAEDICCICRERFKDPCQANCSHWFCGNCILRYWEHGFALQPCNCPLCRRPITLLIRSAATQQNYDHEVNEMLDGIQRYNDRFGSRPNSIGQQNYDHEVNEMLDGIQGYNDQFGSRPNSIGQRFQDLPFLLLRLLMEFRHPQTSILSSFIQACFIFEVLFGLIYFIRAVDFLPERVSGFVGFIDDISLVVIVSLIAATYHTVLLYVRRQISGHQARQRIGR